MDALADAPGLLSAALDALPLQVVVVEANGTVVSVNEAWRRFVKAHRGRIRRLDAGSRYVDICRFAFGREAKAADQAAETIADVVTGKQPGHTVVLPSTRSAKRGGTCWLQMRVTRFTHADQSWSVITCEDVTGSRQAEETLHAAQKAETIGVLAAGVAHDFSHLVALIAHQVEQAREATTDDGLPRKHLDMAEQAIEQAGGITRTLQAYAHGEHAEKQTVSLSEVCRESARLLNPLVPAKTVQVWEIPKGPVPVQANPTQVRQVLMNLVANACDAMPDGGTLTIRLSRCDAAPEPTDAQRPTIAGPHARLDVADTGPGIPPDVRDRIFEPFVTTKHSLQRTGLGLAIVRRIVEQHGGWVDVQSREGAGTTFSVFFPCAPCDVPRDSESDDDASHVPPGTGVLVVGRDAHTRSLTATALREAGCVVEQAGNTRDAVRIARANDSSIQVAVIHAGPGNARAIECLKRIQTASGSIAGVIVAETSNDPGLSAEANALGCPILFKPFRVQQLMHAVKQLATQRAHTRCPI